ncbi:Eco57I restriction-modification methylase domain-containing protein [Qipengyuania sp. 902]|uniref:Eco57I restriction-modification methylase domain-containing protein n=1 Tax=Qipengyuania sp. 902 TaxID=3417565 RepID=UPI003EBA987D
MTDAALFTAGSLFSQDYLIEGIKRSAAYEEIDAAALRERLETLLGAFPHSTRPNEATTESDLVWPVLEALGWSSWLTQQNLSSSGRDNVPDGLLFIDEDTKASANEYAEEWKRYGFGAAIVESKRWGRALDRAEGRSGQERETPSTQLLRYLRRIDDLTNGDLRWGILTNGARWRLYYSGARSTIDDYLEIDVARIMGLEADVFDAAVTDKEREHWLRVFAAMFSRTAFERTAKDAPSFHDRARREAAFYEERVAKSLSDLVFDKLYPSLGKAIADRAPADTDLDEIRNATLILLYRLLFILYAEDRGLLPVKDKRYDDYALREARKDVGERMDAGDTFSSVATPIWDRFSSLAIMIDKGDPSVGLPPYNGGLFSTVQTPLLNDIRLPDSVMAEALDILSYEQRDGLRRYINYRDLSVQQLGSIYERLLEFEMKRVDGEFEVLPNIFARKESGSYYTPDELVLLIIDETLAPLIDDAYAAFGSAIASLGKNDSVASMLRVLEGADPAKAITRLRVCDPAMGSGHFLVSLVDRMTNQALEAMARAVEIAAEAGVEDYQSPIAREIEGIRSTIWHNAQEHDWAIAEEQLDDPQLVKRMILKRCVHGVDKNPMAVELAKVALWLHTFTVGAPLSFIDHHLHCGDSLFGMWVRDAMDKGGEGAALFLHEPLQRAQTQARVMQTIEALTDAEIAEATQSAEMWNGVEAQIGELDGFVKFIHALDWLDISDKREKTAVRALLAGQFGDTIAIMRGREEPFARSTQFQASGSKDRVKAQEYEPSELVDCIKDIVSRARQLIDEERFLNWQIAFPGVWQNWASAGREGGFDAVIGNPPWDRFEFEEVPWFEARDASIALAPSGAKRKAAIRQLRSSDTPLAKQYARATKRMAMATKVAKGKSIYSTLNKGKLNIYKLFVERSHSLVHPQGMVGLLTPSGIAADLSSAKFFRRLSTHGHIKSLYDFENRRTRYGYEPFFPDVDSRFKFAAMTASPKREFDGTVCGFFLQAVRERENPDNAFPVSPDDFSRVNPNTGTAPVFRTRRDMKITTGVYARCPVLHQDVTDPADQPWSIGYSQTINMTSDSHLFRTRGELEDEVGAWPLGGNRYESADGEWVPLYEGKMVQAFNHRAASIIVNPQNVNRPAQPLAAEIHELHDPDWLADPQYWVQPKNDLVRSEYALGFKDVTAPTNVRTMIASMIPTGAAGNTFPLLLLEDEAADPAKDRALLLGNLNALALDYIARQKVQGQHLNWYIVEQLPVIPPAAYNRSFGPKSAAEIVREAVLELTYTAHDMAAFARDMGHVDDAGDVLPPFLWDEERRLQLRAKLDALYFILYGIYDPTNAAQSRDDIRYIYSTFPIVERHELAAWGSYLSRDLALAWINALMANQPDAEVARKTQPL